jgi:secreted PhoX family phosphatase
VFGQLKDVSDRPLRSPDGTPWICSGNNDVPGSGPDFFSLLNDPDGSGKLYMVTQFECTVGAYYLNEVVQDAGGMLRAVPGTLRYVSQKAYHGGWTHCAGSKTPWESHLGSEEYEADGRIIEAHRNADGTTGFEGFDTTARYFGGDAMQANPYYWGWVTEVRIEEGEPNYRKHYAMGRFSHELAYVMPDDKTVYMSDDGTNVGLFMFVADHEANLNSGTLYAARWKQRSTYEGGSADLEWISLGHACASEVRSALEKRPKFSEMFETEAPTAAGSCPTEGFAPVNTAGQTECLRLRTDRYSETVISRLETRRYAALRGATTEFRKEEGITYDPDHRRLYVAMSEIGHGMRDGDAAFDRGGPNTVVLEENPCGAVYALEIAETPQADSGGMPVGSDYAAARMEAILTGMPKMDGDGMSRDGDACAVTGIANPDNLTYLPGSNILVIGEDTQRHANNILWSYDVESGALQRIAVLPSGAEATAPYWYRDINGYGYLSLTVQHPDEGDSYVGVIGPFRSLPEPGSW